MTEHCMPEAALSTDMTLYTVLREYVDLLEGQLRAFSQNGAYHVPKKGWEKPYEETQKKIRMIKDEMKRARYELQM